MFLICSVYSGQFGEIPSFCSYSFTMGQTTLFAALLSPGHKWIATMASPFMMLCISSRVSVSHLKSKVAGCV